jgi:hypothetical protein
VLCALPRPQAPKTYRRVANDGDSGNDKKESAEDYDRLWRLGSHRHQAHCSESHACDAQKNARDDADDGDQTLHRIQCATRLTGCAQSAESGVGRGPDRGVGVEARIGRYGAAISERLSPARISASYAPNSASTIDSTASKGARSAPSRWCRAARNPGEL